MDPQTDTDGTWRDGQPQDDPDTLLQQLADPDGLVHGVVVA